MKHGTSYSNTLPGDSHLLKTSKLEFDDIRFAYKLFLKYGDKIKRNDKYRMLYVDHIGAHRRIYYFSELGAPWMKMFKYVAQEFECVDSSMINED